MRRWTRMHYFSHLIKNFWSQIKTAFQFVYPFNFVPFQYCIFHFTANSTVLKCLDFWTFVSGVAFAVAYYQNKALLGSNGLLPANSYLQKIDAHVKGDIWQKLTYAPSIFWWFDFAGYVELVLSFNIMGNTMLMSGQSPPKVYCWYSDISQYCHTWMIQHQKYQQSASTSKFSSLVL